MPSVRDFVYLQDGRKNQLLYYKEGWNNSTYRGEIIPVAYVYSYL